MNLLKFFFSNFCFTPKKFKKINHDNKIFSFLTKVFILSNRSYVFIFHTFLPTIFPFSRSSTVHRLCYNPCNVKYETLHRLDQVEGKQARLCASGRGYCLGNPCFHTALSSLCGSCEIKVEKFPLNSIEKTTKEVVSGPRINFRHFVLTVQRFFKAFNA